MYNIIELTEEYSNLYNEYKQIIERYEIKEENEVYFIYNNEKILNDELEKEEKYMYLTNLELSISLNNFEYSFIVIILHNKMIMARYGKIDEIEQIYLYDDDKMFMKYKDLKKMNDIGELILSKKMI